MLPALTVGAIVGNSTAVVSLEQLANSTDLAADPADAESGVMLENDGDLIEVDLSGNIDRGDWITPKSAAGNAYEARVTVNTGTLSTGTGGVWQALGTTRSWTVQQTVIGTKTANITVEIRLAITGLVLATKTVDITATVA